MISKLQERFDTSWDINEYVRKKPNLNFMEAEIQYFWNTFIDIEENKRYYVVIKEVYKNYTTYTH